MDDNSVASSEVATAAPAASSSRAGDQQATKAPNAKAEAVEEVSSEVEVRQCVCFFCGKHLVLRSEEEAVAHMSVCVSLQEQLNTEGNIVIPSSLQAEIDAAEEKKKRGER